MGGNRRHRIHPAVACVSIVCLTIITISAEYHAHDPLVSFKIFIATLIGLIAGVKIRNRVPVT
jgi:spore maturation protein SpmA